MALLVYAGTVYVGAYAVVPPGCDVRDFGYHPVRGLLRVTLWYQAGTRCVQAACWACAALNTAPPANPQHVDPQPMLSFSASCASL